jgi:threonylcarbamoyladenosine tRNA methylthiotransferase MtaB
MNSATLYEDEDEIEIYHNKISDNIDVFSADCTVSLSDAEKIINSLDLNDLINESGYIFFDTCAVTESAHNKCKQLVKNLAAKYPKRKFILTGCGVNYDKNFYSIYGTALTNQEKFNILNYGFLSKNNNKTILLNKQKQFGVVKIEDGCYNNCSYCVVNKIRPHYQVPYEEIKKEISYLLKQGKKNIILAGTEISSYNYEDMDLISLCKIILKDFPEINSLKLDPIDPASKIIIPLIEFIKQESKMDNKIFLCTQSCSDSILKSMRRRHNVKRLYELNKIADDKIDFVYQLIIGFPGETDELFQETLNNLKELKPIEVDVMLFSPRVGTDAYNMPNKIDKKIIKKRQEIIYKLYNQH